MQLQIVLLGNTSVQSLELNFKQSGKSQGSKGKCRFSCTQSCVGHIFLFYFIFLNKCNYYSGAGGIVVAVHHITIQSFYSPPVKSVSLAIIGPLLCTDQLEYLLSSGAINCCTYNELIHSCSHSIVTSVQNLSLKPHVVL